MRRLLCRFGWLAQSCSWAQTSRSRSSVQMIGQSMPVELVPQPLHVERGAVLEDRPPAVLGRKGRVGGLEGLLEGAASRMHRADLAQHRREEVAGLLDRGVDRAPAFRDGAAAPDEVLGLVGLDLVKGPGGPLGVERIPRVQRRLGLHKVTREEDLGLGQPQDDVAGGVPSAAPLQDEVASVPAQRDGEPVGEGDVGMGEAGDRLGLQEQTRHPAVLGVPVLYAAFLDEVAGHLVGDDHLGVEGAGAKDAHGVVVGQDQVA